LHQGQRFTHVILALYDSRDDLITISKRPKIVNVRPPEEKMEKDLDGITPKSEV